jgi:hypothetical protein
MSIEIFPVVNGLAAKTFSRFIWASVFEIFETTIALWLGGPSAQMEIFWLCPAARQP